MIRDRYTLYVMQLPNLFKIICQTGLLLFAFTILPVSSQQTVQPDTLNIIHFGYNFNDNKSKSGTIISIPDLKGHHNSMLFNLVATNGSDIDFNRRVVLQLLIDDDKKLISSVFLGNFSIPAHKTGSRTQNMVVPIELSSEIGQKKLWVRMVDEATQLPLAEYSTIITTIHESMFPERLFVIGTSRLNLEGPVHGPFFLKGFQTEKDKLLLVNTFNRPISYEVVDHSPGFLNLSNSKGVLKTKSGRFLEITASDLARYVYPVGTKHSTLSFNHIRGNRVETVHTLMASLEVTPKSEPRPTSIYVAEFWLDRQTFAHLESDVEAFNIAKERLRKVLDLSQSEINDNGQLVNEYLFELGEVRIVSSPPQFHEKPCNRNDDNKPDVLFYLNPADFKRKSRYHGCDLITHPKITITKDRVATGNLTHEFGHQLGAQDMYLAGVTAANNEVFPGAGTPPPSSGIMSFTGHQNSLGTFIGKHWDPISVGFINVFNGSSGVRPADQVFNSWKPITHIQVVDNNDLPVQGVTVSFYMVSSNGGHRRLSHSKLTFDDKLYENISDHKGIITLPDNISLRPTDTYLVAVETHDGHHYLTWFGAEDIVAPFIIDAKSEVTLTAKVSEKTRYTSPEYRSVDLEALDIVTTIEGNFLAVKKVNETHSFQLKVRNNGPDDILNEKILLRYVYRPILPSGSIGGTAAVIKNTSELITVRAGETIELTSQIYPHRKPNPSFPYVVQAEIVRFAGDIYNQEILYTDINPDNNQIIDDDKRIFMQQ